MADMTRVAIDPAKCQGHGRCVIIAPKYFDMDDSGFGVVCHAEVDGGDWPDVDEAVLSCPENAITVSD
jgi:ferredoxin